MSKQTKRKTLRMPPDISSKAEKMAEEDFQSFPKFITKLVVNEWQRRGTKIKVAA